MRKNSTLGMLAIGALLLPAQLAAADGGSGDPALTELVRILREQGVLDEAQYEAIAARAAQRDNQRWTDRIEMWGDFRARYESFHFDDDRVDGQRDRPDRYRLRYRLRLNLKGNVNEYADVFIRLTTGADSRTTNDTLGNPLDFSTNDIFLDKAYVRVSPFENGRLPEDRGSLWFAFGRTLQPWRWDPIYKDWLLWDDEISPAGFYGDAKVQLTDGLQVFANSGLYIIDENAASKDPALTNVQVGFHAEPEGRFDFGARATWFYFWSLDEAFIARGVSSSGIPSATSSAGNTPGGLTGDPTGGTANVLEMGAYVKANLIEKWPIILVGHVSTNLDASRATVTNAPTSALPGTFRTGQQATAWLVGGQIGDPKLSVRFRMLYARLEANAFPSQFVDSDIFDGFTNREGFVWDLSKQVMRDTDASLTLFLSDPVEESGGYLNSLAGSERLRLQANLNWKF